MALLLQIEHKQQIIKNIDLIEQEFGIYVASFLSDRDYDKVYEVSRVYNILEELLFVQE